MRGPCTEVFFDLEGMCIFYQLRRGDLVVAFFTKNQECKESNETRLV